MEQNADTMPSGGQPQFSQRGVFLGGSPRVAVERNHQGTRLGPPRSDPAIETGFGCRRHAFVATHGEDHDVGPPCVLGSLLLAFRLGQHVEPPNMELAINPYFGSIQDPVQRALGAQPSGSIFVNQKDLELLRVISEASFGQLNIFFRTHLIPFRSVQ